VRFLKAVQDKKLKWPTQRDFNVKVWKESAERLAEDTLDNTLAESGLWIHDTLERAHSIFVAPHAAALMA
jgi:hypothetical protein